MQARDALRQACAGPYRVTRLWIIRGLGFIYFNAFAIVFLQGKALFGERGLLPIGSFVDQLLAGMGGAGPAFLGLPSLFYFVNGDVWLSIFGILGMTGGLVLMAGYANVPILLALWLLQLSFVNSGQLFFGYGWESQLCEFTFLCLFLVPPLDPCLKTTRYPAAVVVLWAQRWMLFRLMLGAGLIKIRGDQCWRDLTCLIYHYETQPNPHPLSYLFHQMPALFHYAGALFNHFVELVVPFGLFGPKKVRRAAGLITMAFQIILILSGNLAWLNWLTLLMCLPCFDDEILARIGLSLPPLKENSKNNWVEKTAKAFQFSVFGTFAAFILYLSPEPALNLFRRDQVMNTSYGGWHLLNSYGAFGTVGKTRPQIVISATQDSTITPETRWTEYQFKCAPGDVARMPCLITPYHYHLDWQIWFSSMRPELQEEWLFRMVVRLLQNDAEIKALFAVNPFGDGAPKFIKMDLYRYEFTGFPAWPERWWKRKFLNEYMPPISLEHPLTRKYEN